MYLITGVGCAFVSVSKLGEAGTADLKGKLSGPMGRDWRRWVPRLVLWWFSVVTWVLIVYAHGMTWVEWEIKWAIDVAIIASICFQRIKAWRSQ